MNRGVILQESCQVQQMMARNLNWWNISGSPPLTPSSCTSSPLFPYHPPPSTSASQISSLHETHDQDLPQSWSQLVLGGLVGEEIRCNINQFQAKKMENWDDLAFYSSSSSQMIDVKPEISDRSYLCGHRNEEYQVVKSTWDQILPGSSLRSCATATSINMLDFSHTKLESSHPRPDHSSEFKSTANGSSFKKPKVQPSTQTTFKVKKEKLGDRITALHQLVSPFGKTDTASVLLEAIGYIRFLQGQIEALSAPYLRSGSGNTRQLDGHGEARNLRSRGLCLVPVQCTLQVENDNGADYWAPALRDGFR